MPDDTSARVSKRHAVFDLAQLLLHALCADVGIEHLQRYFATEPTTRGRQPTGCFVPFAQHVRRQLVDALDSCQPVGGGRTQTSVRFGLSLQRSQRGVKDACQLCPIDSQEVRRAIDMES